MRDILAQNIPSGTSGVWFHRLAFETATQEVGHMRPQVLVVVTHAL